VVGGCVAGTGTTTAAGDVCGVVVCTCGRLPANDACTGGTVDGTVATVVGTVEGGGATAVAGARRGGFVTGVERTASVVGTGMFASGCDMGVSSDGVAFGEGRDMTTKMPLTPSSAAANTRTATTAERYDGAASEKYAASPVTPSNSSSSETSPSADARSL